MIRKWLMLSLCVSAFSLAACGDDDDNGTTPDATVPDTGIPDAATPDAGDSGTDAN